MAFGKRGVPKQPARVAPRSSVAKSAPNEARLDQRPPPRVKSHAGLTWSQPIRLTEGYAVQIPEEPGVYALMAGQREVDTVFYGGSKNLRSEFLTEMASQAGLAHPHAKYFSFAPSLTPFEEAQKEVALFKRRYGNKPRLNSGF